MTETKNYIDNAKFVEALTEHRLAYLQAVKEGRETPQVSNYIAECFTLLAKNLSSRYNFNKYTWKDDMVSEAKISCLKSAHKFDASVSNNAFGYFNLLCWRAFTDFIKSEKEHSYIKAKLFYLTPEDSFDVQEQDEGEFGFSQEFMPYFDVKEYERKDDERRAANRKKKDSKQGIEAILDDEVPVDLGGETC